MFQTQETVGEACKVRDVNEKTADSEDGLVVWPGRIGEYSEIPGFINEADLQRYLEKAMATGWWP